MTEKNGRARRGPRLPAKAPAREKARYLRWRELLAKANAELELLKDEKEPPLQHWGDLERLTEEQLRQLLLERIAVQQLAMIARQWRPGAVQRARRACPTTTHRESFDEQFKKVNDVQILHACREYVLTAAREVLWRED